MSFIAAFPAVYRDSLANGKQHNGVHEWNKEPRRVAAGRGGGGGARYRPGVALPLVSPLVTSFAGSRQRSDKETGAAYKGVEGFDDELAEHKTTARVAVIVR